jgi:antitoxin (DNA-binding transcriptional repressor) of toxin-antitoxin stability system
MILVRLDQLGWSTVGEIIKNLYEAKTELSNLVERAARGEEIVIAKNGKPMARLTRFESAVGRRVPGCGKGKIWIADDFNAPLPDEILATLEEPIEPAPGYARVSLVVPGQSKSKSKRSRRDRHR